jgi:hypothetical protein
MPYSACAQLEPVTHIFRACFPICSIFAGLTHTDVDSSDSPQTTVIPNLLVCARSLRCNADHKQHSTDVLTGLEQSGHLARPQRYASLTGGVACVLSQAVCWAWVRRMLLMVMGNASTTVQYTHTYFDLASRRTAYRSATSATTSSTATRGDGRGRSGASE